jgi:tol-pal system protein YbgF
MTRLFPTVLLLTSALLTTPAYAQMFGGGESRQVSDLREEVNERLEQTSRAQLELMNQNEMLRSEVAQLRGQVEMLTHELESLSQRQRDFYVDLDDRLQHIESGGSDAPAAAGTEAESEAYEDALAMLQAGEHRDALEAFKNFISENPRSRLLPSANFWAGNAALQIQEIVEARSFFNTVINNWPDDDLVPDAMLGLANSKQIMGEQRSARDTLEQLVMQYPDSSAAQVAQRRLQQN